MSYLALQTLQPSQEADEARRVVVADMQQLVAQVSATLCSSRSAAGRDRWLCSHFFQTALRLLPGWHSQAGGVTLSTSRMMWPAQDQMQHCVDPNQMPACGSSIGQIKQSRWFWLSFCAGPCT